MNLWYDTIALALDLMVRSHLKVTELCKSFLLLSFSVTMNSMKVVGYVECDKVTES